MRTWARICFLINAGIRGCQGYRGGQANNLSRMLTRFAEKYERVAYSANTCEIHFYNRGMNVDEDSRWYRLRYTIDIV